MENKNQIRDELLQRKQKVTEQLETYITIIN